MSMTIKNKQKIHKIGMFLFLVVLFTMGLMLFGVKKYPDTASYLDMNVVREPGYALLLAGARLMFPNHYFFAVGIIQNLLAVVAIYLVWNYICTCFSLKKGYSYLVMASLLLPYVITPFFAKSGLIISNAMLTEGVTFSLFYLLVMKIMQILFRKQLLKDGLIGLFLALLISMIRGQMMVFILILLLVVMYVGIIKYKKTGIVVIAIFLCMLGFAGRSQLMKLYNQSLNQVSIGGSHTAFNLLIPMLFSSTEQDGASIQDKEASRVFYATYKQMEESKSGYQYADGGMIGQALYLEKEYNRISEYYGDNGTYQNFDEKMVSRNENAAATMKDLFPACFSSWMVTYLGNFLVGLIRTVAVVHPLLNLVAASVYLIFVAVLGKIFFQDRKSKEFQFGILVVILVGTNVVAVSLFIMCISRYMIYNMPFVYIALLLMVKKVYEDWTKNKKREVIS